MKHWSFSIFFIQHSSISTYRSSPHVTLWEVNVFCHFFCLLQVGSPSRKAAALCLQSSFPALWIAARKVTEDFASGCCCFLVLGGSFVNRNSTDWDQGLKSSLWVAPACYQLAPPLSVTKCYKHPFVVHPVVQVGLDSVQRAKFVNISLLCAPPSL